MDPQTINQIISSGLSGGVGFIAAMFTFKGKREENAVAKQRADVDGMTAAVDALQKTVSTLQARMDALEHDLANEQVYTTMLVKHITGGNPPPPPSRPTN